MPLPGHRFIARLVSSLLACLLGVLLTSAAVLLVPSVAAASISTTSRHTATAPSAVLTLHPASDPMALLAVQQAELTASDPAQDNFGCSVALSGDTALVGAESKIVDGSECGVVYVFTRSGTS